MRDDVTPAGSPGVSGLFDRFRALSERRRLGLGLGLTLFIATLPFISVLAGSETAIYGDINDAHIPLSTAAWRAIRHGDSPFWSPLVYAGHNLLGAGQAAIFYAPNALFGWFHPVTAFRCWLLFHVWLAAAGGFAWSWHRWRSLPGAVVSGFAYGLNGFLILHIVHMPLVATAAWLPWMFLGLDLVIERWSFRRAGLLALALAQVAFTGHPQGFWQAGIGLGVLALVQLAFARRGWMAWVRVAGAGAIGLCLAALQLVPLYLFSRTSARPTMTMQGAFLYSDEPRHLVTFVVPRLLGGSTAPAWGPVYHELGNYLGVTMLALAVVGAVRLGRDRRSIGLLCLIAFGIVTAFPSYNIVARWVYEYVPMADAFRAWSRNMILANAAVACLAGAGVREVLAAPAIWGKRLAIGIAGFAAVLAVLPLLTDLKGDMAEGWDGVKARGVPVLFLLGVLGAVWLMTRRRELAVVALIVVCAIDVVSFAATAPWRSAGLPADKVAAAYSADPPQFGLPSDQPGGIDRWITDAWGLRAVALAKGVPGIVSYDPLIQRDFGDMAGGLVDNGRVTRDDFWAPGWLSDVLRVTTLAGTPSLTPTDPAWHRETTVAGGTVRWTRTPRLAEAYLVGDVQRASLAEIRDLLRAPTTDLTQTAYVEPIRAGSAAALGPATPGPSGQVLAGSMSASGSGRWEIDATRPGLFVVSYAWLDGWSATVDGHAVPVTRANGLVLGVPVPAGQHVVELHFTPPGFHLGLLLFVIGLLGLATPSVLSAIRTRRIGRGRGAGDV